MGWRGGDLFDDVQEGLPRGGVQGMVRALVGVEQRLNAQVQPEVEAPLEDMAGMRLGGLHPGAVARDVDDADQQVRHLAGLCTTLCALDRER